MLKVEDGLKMTFLSFTPLASLADCDGVYRISLNFVRSVKL